MIEMGTGPEQITLDVSVQAQCVLRQISLGQRKEVEIAETTRGA